MLRKSFGLVFLRLEYARKNLEDFDRFLESIIVYLGIKQHREEKRE